MHHAAAGGDLSQIQAAALKTPKSLLYGSIRCWK